MTESVRILVAVYVGSLMLAALLMTFIEGWRFIDGLWWAEVASLTIGYGDIAPKSDLGRLIAIVFQSFWALYILLGLGAHIVKFLFRDKNEMTHEEQEWLFKSTEMQFNMLRDILLQNKEIAEKTGITIHRSEFMLEDGTFVTCPPQPSDTSHGDVENESIPVIVRH